MTIRDAFRQTVPAASSLLAHAPLQVPDSLAPHVAAQEDWLVPLLSRTSQIGPEDDHETRVRTAVAKASDLQRRAAVVYMAELFTALHSNGVETRYAGGPREIVISTLARRKMSWEPAEIRWIVQQILVIRGGWHGGIMSMVRIVRDAAERFDPSEVEEVRPDLERLLVWLESATWIYDTERATHARRVREALATGTAETTASLPPHILDDRDPFGPAARAALATEVDASVAARALIHLSRFGTGVRPATAWRRAGEALVGETPAALDAARTVLSTLATLPENRPLDASAWYQPVFITDDSVAVARGAAWLLASNAPSPSDVALLRDVGLNCGIGSGGTGGMSRCGPVANSVVAALGHLSDERIVNDVVAALTVLRDRIQNKTIRKGIDKTLEDVAAGAGISRGQLLERSVPDLGLDSDSRLERRAGEHTAVCRVVTAGGVAKLETRWRKDGSDKLAASVPAAVKEHHPDVVSELRTLAKEVKKLAATQRARVESLMADEREWTGADWTAYYVDHPVVSLTARGLLWQVADAEGGWHSGVPERPDGWVLRSYDGTAHPVTDTDRIRLWHPARETLTDVAAWREHLTDQEVRQPFKQVFREIYLLTPAEGVTDTYSNRFAGHILQYRQAGALMRTRGWNGNHLGYWDGGYQGQASRDFPEVGLRATFYFDLVEQENDEFGTPSLCSTDQVRFERHEPGTRTAHIWQVIPLTDVPPLVLSEAMRDVDLFVGVTSIANDPNWTDAGQDRHTDYWHSTSFGDLTESAVIRREALARLLPRTTLRDRAELVGNYLVVHGRIRDYKIHLGSANILMSPADTYLCIVAGRSVAPTQRVFLPFEEDGGKLAMILSKAFLLAADDEITDPTITHQLRLGLH
ncbi:MAG: DUF4132 domain-containing protein [Nocardioidaceae bacterium]